jgi:AAHS family 4-hydroxybenzoate transporter-like MFS transporter
MTDMQSAVSDTGSALDINAIIEEQTKMGGFVWNLLTWTFLVMLLDGFDFTGLSFVIPHLARQWKVSPGRFGPAIAAGVFGMMVGSFFFGWLGDRIGRKKTIILGCWIFGAFTLASIWAPSILGLGILRFIAGFGLYAAVPNSIVLVNEYAPKRLKVTWTIAMFTGFSVGGIVAGLVAAFAIDVFSWRIIFFLGGILPLLMTLGLIFALPESIRFLALKEQRRGALTKILSKMRPDIAVTAATRFVIQQEQQCENFTPKLLFTGVLLYMTPVIWLFYLFNSTAVYFLQNWMPVLIHNAGLTLSRASLTAALFQVGGTTGGLITGWLIDRLGMWVIGVVPTCACIVTAFLGYSMPEMILMCAAFLAGIFVIGTQNAVTVVPPLVYPTSYRAKAVGAMIAIGKIGSISGPIIGGVLLQKHLPLRSLFYVAAIPLLLGAIFAFTFAALYRRHFSGATRKTQKASARA